LPNGKRVIDKLIAKLAKADISFLRIDASSKIALGLIRYPKNAGTGHYEDQLIKLSIGHPHRRSSFRCRENRLP